MLSKLLKYDLKSIFKVLIIFYSIGIFFGLLTRIFFSFDNSVIMDVIAKVCSGVTISMIFNILINNLLGAWGRFRRNLYGDESYLTHTLPIDKKTIYLSKILTAVITLFSSIVVIGVMLFVAYYSKENLELIKSILLPVADVYGSTIVMLLLAFLFIFFIEFACLLQSGFTGIILGHRKNNAKIGYSILFAIITYIVTQVFCIAVVFLVALFNKDLMNLFYTTELVNVDIIRFVIYLATITYFIIFIIEYFINVKIFNKGVNVD
jgi:hypothetical protein